jgi:hypothetical protein
MGKRHNAPHTAQQRMRKSSCLSQEPSIIHTVLVQATPAPVAATTTPLVPQSLDYAGRPAAPRRSDARLAE